MYICIYIYIYIVSELSPTEINAPLKQLRSHHSIPVELVILQHTQSNPCWTSETSWETYDSAINNPETIHFMKSIWFSVCVKEKQWRMYIIEVRCWSFYNYAWVTSKTINHMPKNICCLKVFILRPEPPAHCPLFVRSLSALVRSLSALVRSPAVRNLH